MIERDIRQEKVKNTYLFNRCKIGIGKSSVNTKKMNNKQQTIQTTDLNAEFVSSAKLTV